MEDAPLLELYRRHVGRFHDGSDPFGSTDHVAEAARRCEGRAGVFLGWLRYAYQFGDPAQLASFAGFVQSEWKEFVRREPGLADVITRSATHEGGILAGADLDRLRPTASMRFVYEDTTSDRTAQVDPVLLSVLREVGS